MNISKVEINVTGPSAHTADITGKFKTDALPFVPLYKIASVSGLSGQIGRPTDISVSVGKTDPNNKSSASYIIHGLSIVTS
jgi:hypothetical protein